MQERRRLAHRERNAPVIVPTVVLQAEKKLLFLIWISLHLALSCGRRNALAVVNLLRDWKGYQRDSPVFVNAKIKLTAEHISELADDLEAIPGLNDTRASAVIGHPAFRPAPTPLQFYLDRATAFIKGMSMRVRDQLRHNHPEPPAL